MLTLLLIIVYIIIYYFLLKYTRRILSKIHTEPPTIPECALVSSMIIVLVFITAGLIYILSAIPRHATAGIGLFFLPLYAVYVGIVGFIISWFVLTLFTFFSAKRRSVVPKKTWVLYIILAIFILIAVSVSTYTFIARRLILREAESPQIDQTRLEEIYAKVMKGHDTEILKILAQNSQTPVPILEEIYASYPQDLNDGIYYSLATNKNTPSEILGKLAKSKWGFVRNAVADNPNTPAKVLRILADDKDFLVKVSVTRNPNVTRDILLKLKVDHDNAVRLAASSSWQNREFDRKAE